MGLEDIVNVLLKPLEKLAAKIVSYAPKSLHDGLQAMVKDYFSVKEFLMKYTLRPIDTVFRTGYNILEAPFKAFYDPLDKHIFTPVRKYVKENPWKVAAFVSLSLGLSFASLWYVLYSPLYA